jgi:putative ABC transport system permease protein
MLQDLRYAIRAMNRMRGTAAVTIGTLAVGIAATTTMFSVVYATLLRPLPFRDPERLLMLFVVRQAPRTGTSELRWPLAKIVALKGSVHSFDAIATYTTANTVSVVGDAGAEQTDTEIVSASYLDVLGVPVAAGRAFSEQEDGPGHAVALVSTQLWQRHFGGRAFEPNRTLLVNAVPLTIVGVLPDSFRGLSARTQLWIPIGMAPQLTYRDYLTTPQHFINVIARLKRDVSLAQANAELAAVGPRLPNAIDPSAEPAIWSSIARTLGDVRVDPGLRRSSLILFAAVGCLLLVTCINVAGLLLMQAYLRRREIAVRIAIGAGRARIVRQMLTETGALALCGGACGVLLAAWGIAAFGHLAPDVGAPTHTGYVQVGAFAAPAMDATALAFTALLTLGCTVIAGLAPAIQTVRSDPGKAIAQSSRSTLGPESGRTLRALAGAQIAIAVLLVAGALLLLATFLRLQQTRVGFDPSRVLVFWLTPPGSTYSAEAGPAIIERLLERIERVPGVTRATVNRCTPFSSSCARTIVFFPERPTPAAMAPSVGRHYVSADYFRALGIPVLNGRALTADDRPGRPPVTVINETAARRFWPGADPIGRHVWFGSAQGFMDPSRPVEVVGVVADVKYWPLDEPPGPDFYTSYLQFAYPDTAVILQASSDPLALVPALRTAVASVDRTIPVSDVRLLDDRVSEVLSRPRFNAMGMAGFAGLTVLLAAMGIFGAISAGVAARARELAIRVALGATSARLRRMVLGQALHLAAIGSVAGLAGAWLALRFLSGALFGVTPADPMLLGAATIFMAGVALLAALLPARRAAATDPTIALKSE